MNFAFLLAGAVFGFILGFLFVKTRSSGALASSATLEERVKSLDEDRARLNRELQLRQDSVLELNRELVAAQSGALHLKERLDAQKDYMEELRKQTKMEFENLAQQVLESKSKIFTTRTEESVENLLKPFREKLVTFEKKVDDNYSNEAKERFALKGEVERLILLNERMTQETNHLTAALKGDSKFQGDWGELVLEKILESSGLREGHEYTLQAQHESEAGDRFKPDVIIHLPDNKHIVIDSKVSLKAYELYCRAGSDEERILELREHIRSVEKHVAELADKHYSRLKGIKSPDFVFLFMPVEPAYLLAVQNDADLAQKAWKKTVAIVTATTLLTSLRTVASIWKLENQKKNADEIAAEAGKLYDKFVGFLEDFQDIGRTFESGQKQYGKALGKLREGPGNVIRKIELLRELGAEPTKRIPDTLLD